MNCTNDVQIKSLEINSLKLKKCRYNKLFRGWGRSLYTKIQTENANIHWHVDKTTRCADLRPTISSEKNESSFKGQRLSALQDSETENLQFPYKTLSWTKGKITWLNISPTVFNWTLWMFYTKRVTTAQHTSPLSTDPF